MWSMLVLFIGISAKIIGSFLLFCFLFLIGFRFWLEPFKGICKCKTKLHGKIALITGGNSGIGFETAKDLARRGAKVIIASRDVEKSEEAVANIIATTGNESVEHRFLNLLKKDSIEAFAKDFNKEFHRLDILVNNAGIGTIKKQKTEDGIDKLMQINYLGPFTLTHLLLDKLIASKPSRIVNVSSYLHKMAKFDFQNLTDVFALADNTDSFYNQMVRYGNTKLCDILWTVALAKKLPSGVTANVLHPGLVKTNIFNNFNPHVKGVLFLIIDLLYKTPLEGAQTIIHLCVSPKLDNETGSYYMDCKKVSPSKAAEDEDLAERLWHKTLSLIKQ
ncbi:retinol dehydrogenase 12-like [Vanessa atalanta]|uniref:retinol dehydrogenase 12-like n=1 Tax=Vanessa atalanta TaxID=42275 RepID=UPI001FCDFB50|nr:retinol dehydrogenase 12-like [Vanessa atalanta]